MQLVRAYPRVSTEEQFQEGFSIAAQREKIQQFCDSQGWVIAEWYVEEGKSAKDLDRPQLARLRADLRPGEIVVVYKLDRLTRSVMDLHSLLQEWDKQKIAFRSVTELYDTTTAIGRLFITLVAAMAQWERENLAERVKMGMAQMVREGRWYGGLVPFGYQYDKAAGRLVPQPTEAVIVRNIYRWFAEGKGARPIAIELNRQGVKTKQGAKWSAPTVYWILNSPVYRGHTLWNKRGDGEEILVENTHEPIITAEEAAAVVEVRRRNAHKHPREIASTFPLSGLLRCGLCGARVNGKTQRGEDRRVPYRSYKCQERQVRKGCTLPSMIESKVDAALLDKIRELANRTTLESIVDQAAGADRHADERHQLEVELGTIARKIRRWWDDYDAGDIPARVANERTAELGQRETEIRRRLAEITPEKAGLSIDNAIDLLNTVVEEWEILTVEERKAVFAELFESIALYPGYKVEPKLKPLRR